MRHIGRRDMLLGLGGIVAGVAGTSVLGGRPLEAAVRPVTRRGPKARTFGTAVTPAQLLSPATERVLAGHCQFLVPEYHSQWSAIEWRRGDPWYGDLDAIVNFAKAHDMTARGHSLIWEQMTPDWARAAMPVEGWSVVRRHFSEMLTRYDRATLPEWIVVNECIDTEDGDDGFRRTSFQRAFGNSYVRRAFEEARALAPGAKLFLNDYSIEYDNPVDARRRRALLLLVEDLRHHGLIDGVGIQAHLELGKGKLAAAALDRMMSQFRAMGLEIAITELDVLEDDRSADMATRDRRVAEATGEFLAVVGVQPAVTSLATWGLYDQQSWLQDRHPETKRASAATPPDARNINRGLPFAADDRPKPMWESMQARAFV